MRKGLPLVAGVVMFFCFSILVGNLAGDLDAGAEPDSGNDYPIVFVHGLGWGFGEQVVGMDYWGGTDSIKEELEDRGHEVYIANVSPFASNWDRAAELYAVIKGGTVDYGEAHSQEYGHDRYGKTYEGLYPEWGEKDPQTGEVNKIHLVGHSMGGQTIRTLVQLLEEGCPEEREQTTGDEISKLFSGEAAGKVASITSVATPHDGSTIADDVDDFLPFFEDMVKSVSRFLPEDNQLYDFGLQHWGLHKEEDESMCEYYKRLFDSEVWETKDISAWDLHTEGAKELNSWVEAQPDVYYFSINNTATSERVFSDNHRPHITMMPFLRPFARRMGRTEIYGDPDWKENDGLVSLPSMTSPTQGSEDEVVEYDGNPEPGKWNKMDKLENYCHMSIIGMYRSVPMEVYTDLADTLSSLPVEE